MAYSKYIKVAPKGLAGGAILLGEHMKPEEILKYCAENLEGIALVESWGEKGVFYNPNHEFKRGVYVLTIKEKDGDNDKGSNLNRDGIYRLNIGLRKTSFTQLFDRIPVRPAAGCVIDMDYDFTTVNTILPHPVYAWMGWVGIINPSEDTFEKLKPLIQEAYEFSIEKFRKRRKAHR